MRYALIFSNLASDDLTEALGWYKSQNIAGLEKRFIEAMSQILKRLESNPELNPFAHKDIRQAFLKTFPYKILYYVDNQSIEVNIIAVIHKARDSKVWKKRI
jgi:plasmid stabilization system protein ParE